MFNRRETILLWMPRLNVCPDSCYFIFDHHLFPSHTIPTEEFIFSYIILDLTVSVFSVSFPDLASLKLFRIFTARGSRTPVVCQFLFSSGLLQFLTTVAITELSSGLLRVLHQCIVTFFWSLLNILNSFS